jgi:hypothetical protein
LETASNNRRAENAGIGWRPRFPGAAVQVNPKSKIAKQSKIANVQLAIFEVPG